MHSADAIHDVQRVEERTLNQQWCAKTIRKPMADYRLWATIAGSDWVEPVADLVKPSEVTVVSIVQAAACRRRNNLFLIRALPVLFTGTFHLSRLRPCQHRNLGNG